MDWACGDPVELPPSVSSYTEGLLFWGGGVVGCCSSSVALQPGVGLGLLYNTPPGLSIPCSVNP